MWIFLISNYLRSNFANSPMELDFDKVYRKGSKKVDPTQRTSDKKINIDMLVVVHYCANHLGPKSFLNFSLHSASKVL